MTTKLKLHISPTDSGASENAEDRTVFKFPGAGGGDRNTRQHGPRLVSQENDAAAHAGIDPEDLAARPISSADLVRQIESTLDRMQSRLDRFKRQMNDTFKFPEPSDDDDRPFAA